jgi:processive 1,2-diacylglycerol beta-glucosyltransferase
MQRKNSAIGTSNPIDESGAIAEPAEMAESQAATRQPRVLLLYASAGAGHRSACAAIQRSIVDLSPAAYVKMIDILDYMPKFIAQIYSQGYVFVASRYPMIWYLMYESGSDLAKYKPFSFWEKLLWKSAMKPLFELLQYERPSHIVSAHFLSSWAAGRYKWKYDSRCVVSTVVTDYGVHPVWITPGQDYVFVATEQIQAELAPFARHLGTDRILPLGIPIHPNFARRKDIDPLRAKYKLDPDRYTVLILGGMFGSRNIKDILFWLAECRTRLQLILVAGRHYPIMENIKDRMVERDIKYEIFGYIDFMDELMAVSDLAITKAGALTTSECLAQSLPMIIFRPYPGQEVRNCDYFLEQGVAVRVDQLSGLTYKVDKILGDPARLTAMRNRANEIARPDSSNKIAKILLNLSD